MTCPKCHSELEDATSTCPDCGVRLMRNVSGVMKTSAVLIAAGSERGFYRSVQEVPEPLRAQLIETTSSQNSGIIVIADKAGKEQLTQVLARREAGAEDVEAPPAEEPEPTPPAAMRISWLAWAGFLLVLILSAVIFALFQMHW
jgi:hypothetical protein